MESWILRGRHVLLEHVLTVEMMNDYKTPVNTTHLLLLQHFILHERFHGIYSACVRLLDEPHLIEESISGVLFPSHTGTLTLPNAPFPMTLTVLKSSRQALCVAVARMWILSCRATAVGVGFRSSLVKASAANFRSSSTRLFEWAVTAGV